MGYPTVNRPLLWEPPEPRWLRLLPEASSELNLQHQFGCPGRRKGALVAYRAPPNKGAGDSVLVIPLSPLASLRPIYTWYLIPGGGALYFSNMEIRVYRGSFSTYAQRRTGRARMVHAPGSLLWSGSRYVILYRLPWWSISDFLHSGALPVPQTALCTRLYVEWGGTAWP